MEKTLSKTNSNFIIYFLIILLRCIAYVPDTALGFSIAPPGIDIAPAHIVTFVALVLFAVVCTFVISKLTSDGEAAIFIALLFFLDPIFKHSFFSISHIVILSALALVVFYAIAGKNLVLKWLFAVLFCAASVLICPEAMLSYVPLTVFVCILSGFQFAKSATVKKNPKNALFTIAFLAALVAVCIAAWLLNKKIHNVTNFIYSFSFTSLSISLQYHLPRFLVANIPFVIIFGVFFKNYMRTKASGKYYGFIICLVVAYAAMVTGAFVFKHNESFTLINQLIVMTLATVYYLDKTSSTAALKPITDWFKAHPYLTISLLIAWILITQSFFQEMQQTTWSKIINTTGELV